MLPDGGLEIDLAQVPAHLRDVSARNIEWNVKLLNLMQKARLIRQEAPAQRKDPAEEIVRTADRPVLRVVAELDGRLNNHAFFEKEIDTQRRAVQKQQRAALDQLTSLIRSDRCVAEVLAEHYRMSWNGGFLTTTQSCRSCPDCRRSHREPDATGLRRRGPSPWPDSAHWPDPADPLARYRGDSVTLSIHWSQRSHVDDLLSDMVVALARRHSAVVGGPGLTSAMLRRAQRKASRNPIILDDDESLLDSYEGPVLWVLDDPTAQLREVLARRLDGPAPTYLVHPADLPDPHRPHTPFRYMNKSIALEILLKDSAW